MIVLAAIVAVLVGSLAAAGLGLGLFGPGYGGAVLMMGPDSLPSRAIPSSALRRLRWTSSLSVVLVILTTVLLLVDANPGLVLAVGVVAMASSEGVAWALVT
jgi:hypothetical protein